MSEIRSTRLRLIPLTVAFLEASLKGHRAQAEAELGLQVPPDWYAERNLIDIRLRALRQNPDLEPWLLRAIGLQEQPVMVGHIGFHSLPDPAYLRSIAPGGVELGYTVYPPYRRMGYAREASLALMNWASQAHGVERFVVSIRPDNEPSLRMAELLGFVRIGEHLDEQDGLEYIFVLHTGAQDDKDA